MSNYSCSLLCTIATLQNEGTFAQVMTETQWTYWSDWYSGNYYLIYFTKDWKKFYLYNFWTLAKILNILGDRLELLPRVYW